MKTYVDKIIKRIEAILDTEVIEEVPPRVFTPGEMVGLVSITLSQDEGKRMTAIPAKQVEDFLADPKAHTPEDAQVGLACMFIRMSETQSDHAVGYAAVSTKMFWDRAHNNGHVQPLPIPPQFTTERKASEINWDYCDIDNFIWRDVEGNDKNRFPYNTTESLYVDVEYILMLVIGNNFLFPKLANVIVNYFTYYLDDDTPAHVWGEETFNRLLVLHHRANLYGKEMTSTTIH